MKQTHQPKDHRDRATPMPDLQQTLSSPRWGMSNRGMQGGIGVNATHLTTHIPDRPREVVLDPKPDHLMLYTVTFIDTGEKVYWDRQAIATLTPIKGVSA